MARESGPETLEVACQLAQKYGKPSTAIVLNELRRLTRPPRVAVVETPDTLSLREEPVANCDRYDTLREVAHV
ncbi:hypothetical protein [Paludibacterium denitrificans]|uniref:hypothetical protein n=1 Tax=Paludibacterium denitrificans TaxID=2675226 RepID=UPI001E3EEB8A|nr:hypothetical protein [Paludibacterium denitrificans]